MRPCTNSTGHTLDPECRYCIFCLQVHDGRIDEERRFVTLLHQYGVISGQDSSKFFAKLDAREKALDGELWKGARL